MNTKIIAYRQKIDGLLSSGNCDWAMLKEGHLMQISFYQHERIISFIMLALFILVECVSVIMLLLSPALLMAALCTAIPVLIIFLVIHYHTLESEILKLYEQYESIQNECIKQHFATAVQVQNL